MLTEMGLGSARRITTTSGTPAVSKLRVPLNRMCQTAGSGDCSHYTDITVDSTVEIKPALRIHATLVCKLGKSRNIPCLQLTDGHPQLGLLAVSERFQPERTTITHAIPTQDIC